jgi:hypothetical protein
MTAIVRALHDPASQLMDLLLARSEQVMRGRRVSAAGRPAMILSGLILRRIFDLIQDEFTAAEPRTIPTIAVIEEAQSVLSRRRLQLSRTSRG